MDRSDMRRGKPAVHTRWNDNVAILSGDAMMIWAYRLLSQCDEAVLPQLLAVFTDVAVGVCEGQQYDMDFESRDDVTVEEYLRMIELKTAVLLAGALKIGALCGGAEPVQAELLYRFGIDLGMAFQLQDDLLDTYGDPAVFGKAVGGDILVGKKTYLLTTALKAAMLRPVRGCSLCCTMREWLPMRRSPPSVPCTTRWRSVRRRSAPSLLISTKRDRCFAAFAFPRSASRRYESFPTCC